MDLSAGGRRRVAIMAADVVGYSRLMAEDEDDVFSRLMSLRDNVIEPVVGEHHGLVFKHTGDGFLAAFETAAEAFRCALALQPRIIEREARFPADRRILFRAALNVCEAIIQGGDLFGDGINVAARLQAYAEPGDLVMTAVFADEVGPALRDRETFDLGELHLKNISRPVRAVGMRVGGGRRLLSLAPVSPAPEKPSIAVLPFRQRSPGPDTAVVADGIVEEIVRALAARDELFVISRTSTLRYADKVIDPRSIGQDLAVRYVLHGSVQHSGDTVRIGTELSETEQGRVIRADRYDGPVSDIFELQARIAVDVAKTIAPHVLEWEVRRAMRKHPDSMTAYDLVVQALPHLFRLSYESHSVARGLLQQAMVLDPNYAPAYTYTAYWHIFRVGEGWSRDPDADSAEAARIAQEAIVRDPNDALALAICGHVRSFLLHDFEAANAILERAIEVGPNCALAWSMSSLTLGYLGDCGRAVERAEHGVRLSPSDVHTFWSQGVLAQAYYLNDDFAAATAWARRTAARNPAVMFNLRVLAASLVAQGRLQDARRVGQEILALSPGFSLERYAKSCPFTGSTLARWLDRLAAAGLAEPPQPRPRSSEAALGGSDDGKHGQYGEHREHGQYGERG